MVELDPRFGVLAELERIEMIIGHVSARLASENATLERLVGEGARAIALGLVYVGDQIGGRSARVVDPAEYLPYLDARLIGVAPEPGAWAVFTIGSRTFRARLGETFRLYVDLAGRPDVRVDRGYKAALEKIAHMEETMADAPTDDRMREIATLALAAGER